MTLDGSRARPVTSCPACASPSEPGDRYCLDCGTELERIPAPRPVPQARPAGRPSLFDDATTRYLCAAAHLDAEFGDDAIREHLVERTRAVAPSPGVDSAAVLREAVAARARRRIRDAALLALLVIVTVLAPFVTVVWFLLGLLGSGVLGPGLVDVRYRPRRVWAVVGGLALLLVAVPAVLAPLALTAAGVDVGRPAVDGRTWGAILTALVASGVLIADEAVVDRLVRHRFRPGSFRADARELPDGWERSLRLLGTAEYADQIDRVARSDERRHRSGDEADVIVYRGPRPFLGAGAVVSDGVVPLPLTPGTDDDGTPSVPRPFASEELHTHVADAVEKLRDSWSLAPSGRFATLLSRDNVIVPVEQLLRDLGRQPDPPILPTLSEPPLAHLPSGAARALANHPREWARHYRCYRIEAWDRNLAVSTFFAASTDERMLYLEMTQCVLPPIRQRYRGIDHTPTSAVLTRALATAVLLPTSVVARAVTLFRPFRPIEQPPGEVAPARYGAASSLREQAAAGQAEDFFQIADAERYARVVERTVVRAVGRFLEEHGYSVVDFMEAARASITNNHQVITGNQFSGRQQFTNGAAAPAAGPGTATRSGA